VPNPNTNGGNYWFQINPQTPVGRSLAHGFECSGRPGRGVSEPGFTTKHFQLLLRVANPGSNGFVLDASQFQPGQTWYILSMPLPPPQWNLVTGDAFVYNLGSLAPDNSSSTNASVGAEGMIFFDTTIPTNTLAWQLWLNGPTNTVYVKKSFARTRNPMI